MEKFTVAEAKMFLENGSKLNQVFSCSIAYLEDFVQDILETCNQTKDRDFLRVRGWYDTVGFVLEIFFPLETNSDVQIMFDNDVHLNVNESTGQFFYAGRWYEIGFISARVKDRKMVGFGSDLYKGKEPVEVKEDKGDKEGIRSYNVGYTSARAKDRSAAGFGSDLYKDKEPVEVKEDKEVIEDKEDVRSYNVGASDYAQHNIQPWDIWREYNLNPWDADIVKRVLRTKETDGRRLDYEKIIHICKERIRQIDEYGK